MSKPFHNPFHFVPLGEGGPPATVPLDEFVAAKPGAQDKPRIATHITHDRFVEGSHSGRLVCKVTVETPLICANIQDDNKSSTRADGAPNPRHGWTKLLRPFEIQKGEPALPASSLRGMLSVIAEAASHSALRVLEDRRMSYRRSVSEGLSAIGMIVEKQDKIMHILPLAEPHFNMQTNKPIPNGDWSSYGEMFPNDRPKIYFGESNDIGTPGFLGAYKSNSIPTGGPFYAVHDSWLAVKIKGNRFRLGEMIERSPSAQAERRVRLWDDLSDDEKSSGRWIRGILRVLGKYPKRANALPTKKHEFFLRYSVEDETNLKNGKADLFPVDPEAVSRFNDLADERAAVENSEETAQEELLPFTPHGMSRPKLGRDSGRPETSWRLKAGDIVFFRPSEDGRKVVEISLSSAWRGRVEENSPDLSSAAPLQAFIHRELRPLTPARKTLTLAEQLFGVVELRDPEQIKTFEKPAFALASRVRVSHGSLHSAPDAGAYQPGIELISSNQKQAIRGEVRDIPLKNLASPKPPSPAMYFKKRNGDGAYIPKKNLNPADHAIHGRKLYLRRDSKSYAAANQAFVHPDRLANPQERSAIARQHQSVERFVRPGTTFFFHLDFDNLSDLELQLLTFALQPGADFRHQIGHGKPFGLGQIKVEISGLLTVNRSERYRGDLLASRWNQAWAEGSPKSDWPEALRRHLPDQFEPLQPKLGELKAAFEKWAEDNRLTLVLRSIELIGKPLPPGSQIHYPQAGNASRGNRAPIHPGTADFEREHYQWFAQNDESSRHRKPGQYLSPLTNSQGQVASALPTLHREQNSAPPHCNYKGRVRNESRPASQSGQPALIPTNAGSLGGRPAKAKAAKHETLKHGKIRVRFSVFCDGFQLTGYLLQPDPNNDRRKYPENPDMEYDFIVVNPKKVGGRWQCQLKMP